MLRWRSGISSASSTVCDAYWRARMETPLNQEGGELSTRRWKRAIQAFLRRTPAVRHSRFWYRIQRLRQYRMIRVDPSLTERKDIVETLVKDGLFVQPGYVSRDVCEKIIAEYQPHI